MNNNILISICIPSYNRPEELNRLLNSIDNKNKALVQIVICEDNAPKRTEIRSVVESFKDKTLYNVIYSENIENLGHGGNFRECIQKADGDFIVFMGDDDMFIPETLDEYCVFLNKNRHCGYILRSSRQLLNNGKHEYFRYFPEDKFFEPGIDAYTQLFLKSVFMSGFTIKRSLVKDINIDSLDDTLLFQLYLLAEVCLKHPSAYYNTPIVQGIGDGVSFFGTNEKEKDFYTPGKLVTNNLNFINGFLKITNFIDNKYKLKSTEIVKIEMSKYSFPLMSMERSFGKKHFKEHCRKLKKMGLGSTVHFNLYYFGLLIFGEKFCKHIILLIKKILKRRIKL
jgi:abequosyltransferase